MGSRQTGEFELETGPFVAATVLIGVGGLLAFIGVIVACLHALSQGSELVKQLETPPNELARTKMNQFKAAATAGAAAWKGFGNPDGGSTDA